MIDTVIPGEKWEFNDEVAACFANMLERSIPDYKSMRALVYKIGEKYVTPGTLIVDIGCSTGLAVEPFVKKYRQNRFLLIDNAPAMAAASRERFKDNETVMVKEGPAWHFMMPGLGASLILSVLSLQFMPTSYRQRHLSAGDGAHQARARRPAKADRPCGHYGGRRERPPDDSRGP